MRASILLPASVLAVLGAFAQPCYQQQFGLTGSAPMAPLVRDVADRMHGDCPLHVATADTAHADAAVLQFALAAPATTEVVSCPIATAATVFVVHPHRTLTDLTTAQVAGLCAGTVRNWLELGGPDAPIRFVIANEFARDQLQAHLATNALTAAVPVGSDHRCARSVTGDPFTIGCMSAAVAQREIENGAPMRLVAFDGVAATSASIQDQSYPLTQPLFLNVPSALRGIGDQVLDYLGTERGGALLVDHGYERRADYVALCRQP